jgi:ABC-2 type transport system ATP-binding protein
LCRQIAIIDRGEIIQNTSIKQLLQQLNKETFIFDSPHFACAPDLPGFNVRLIDSHSIEVDLVKGQNLNQVFQLLNEQQVTITSMRNKSNRLEELFVSLVQANKQGGQDAA